MDESGERCKPILPRRGFRVVNPARGATLRATIPPRFPMKTLLCTLLFLTPLVSAKETTVELLTREVPWGEGVRIAEFGGPDLEIFVRAREMTHVVAEVVDYTRLVPVARANIQGVIVDPARNTAAVIANPDAKMVPMKTTVRVEKKRGTPFPGGRYEMYLLFQEPESGIAIYFLDSIARQNHDNVVIALPKTPRLTGREIPRGEDPPAAASPLLPELADWYRRLLEERRTLDTADAAAVERFNQHAADYHSALEKTRAARDALKLAPGKSAR